MFVFNYNHDTSVNNDFDYDDINIEIISLVG